MVPVLFKFFVFNILVCQVLSSYLYQYPTKQYYQQPYPPVYPKPPYSEPYQNYQQLSPATASFIYPKNKPNLPYQDQRYQNSFTPNLYQGNYPRTELKPNLPVPEVKPCQKPQIPEIMLKEEKRRGLDPNILNNLAIALQLLIVSNIISNPSDLKDVNKLPDDDFKTYKKIQELTGDKDCLDKTPFQTFFETNAMELQRMLPNAKFLGDGDVMNSYTKPVRTGGLMSPYEAINTNSFDGQYTKNDFQNPYSAMMAYDNNKDLFSMSDLFSG